MASDRSEGMFLSDHSRQARLTFSPVLRAWSASCSIGDQFAQARLWFDGRYAYNAKEDAAEDMMKYFTVKQNMRQIVHNKVSKYADLSQSSKADVLEKYS